MTNTPETSRQKLFAIITVTISIICGILLVEYMLGWYRQSIENSSQMDDGFMRYHPQLGWTLTPGWQGKHKHHDYDVSYSIDQDGFRTQPQTNTSYGSKTIALLGDSFTFGFGVNDDETFAAQLALSDTNSAYLNLGIPGYSTDQQYLQMGQQSLKQGKTQTINHYVLMFYLGNDILDNMLSHPLQAEPAKPYFTTDGQNLSLKNIPVPRVKKPAALRLTTLNDLTYGNQLNQFYTLADYVTSKSEILKWLFPQKANASAEQLDEILSQHLAENSKLLFILLKAMNEEAHRQKAEFSVAVLPGSSYINAPDSYSYYFQEHVRQAVIGMTDKLGINTIDLAPALRQHQNEPLYFPNERHLTPSGNKIVSEILQQQLVTP